MVAMTVAMPCYVSVRDGNFLLRSYAIITFLVTTRFL